RKRATNDRPTMPTTERLSSQRNGLRPPLVSTHAENGIRSSEPESEGAATRKPRASGPSPMTFWKRFADGPKRATAAKPTKKPSVALHRARRGDPTLSFMVAPPSTPASEAKIRFDVSQLTVG